MCKNVRAVGTIGILVALGFCVGCPCVDCPNLQVSVDRASIDVACPGGGGTCVTMVDVTVSNTGTVDAGAFVVEVAFDPSQSVVRTQAVAGLAAGASTTLTIQALPPPGNNCFDPDCTVCATADSTNTVSESNETDNTSCETKIG